MKARHEVWLVNSFSPYSIGGAQTATRSFTESFQEKGYSVRWFYPSEGEFERVKPDFPPNEVEITPIKNMSGMFVRRFPTPIAIQGFVDEVNVRQPDKIIFSVYNDFHLPLISGLKLSGIPDHKLVYVFHGNPDILVKKSCDPISLSKQLMRRARQLLHRAVLSNSDIHIVAVSGSSAEGINRLGISSRISVCYPPGQPSNPCEPCETKGSEKDHVNLLTVSRISPEKGIDWLISLANSCKRISLPALFTLVGPYLDEQYFQKIAPQLESARIEYAGIKSGCDLCKTYLQSDLVVMPSPQEGFPLVSTESLRHGRPLLAKGIPPHREMFSFFQEAPGFLTSDTDERQSINQAVNFINEFLSNPSLRKHLSDIALHGKLLFDPKTLANRFTECILSFNP